MPIGPPSYLPEPKSACMPSSGPIARTTASDVEAFGSLSTRWFQGLFFGKIAQPPTFGGGVPAPSAVIAVALTAATKAGRTNRRRRIEKAGYGLQPRAESPMDNLAHASPHPPHCRRSRPTGHRRRGPVPAAPGQDLRRPHGRLRGGELRATDSQPPVRLPVLRRLEPDHPLHVQRRTRGESSPDDPPPDAARHD